MPLFALRPTFTAFAAITLAPLSYIVLNRWLFERVWLWNPDHAPKFTKTCPRSRAENCERPIWSRPHLLIAPASVQDPLMSGLFGCKNPLNTHARSMWSSGMCASRLNP